MFITAKEIPPLIFSVCVILSSIGLVVLIKKYGKIPIGHVGPDMNLLTYGFLWDVSFSALQGEKYFKRISESFPGERGLILIGIAFLNLILLAWNFRITDEIDSAKKKEPNANVGVKRTLSLWVGLFSLFTFVVIKVKLN